MLPTLRAGYTGPPGVKNKHVFDWDRSEYKSQTELHPLQSTTHVSPGFRLRLRLRPQSSASPRTRAICQPTINRYTSRTSNTRRIPRGHFLSTMLDLRGPLRQEFCDLPPLSRNERHPKDWKDWRTSTAMVSGIRNQVSGIKYQVSGVKAALSPKPSHHFCA